MKAHGTTSPLLGVSVLLAYGKKSNGAIPFQPGVPEAWRVDSWLWARTFVTPRGPCKETVVMTGIPLWCLQKGLLPTSMLRWCSLGQAWLTRCCLQPACEALCETLPLKACRRLRRARTCQTLSSPSTPAVRGRGGSLTSSSSRGTLGREHKATVGTKGQGMCESCVFGAEFQFTSIDLGRQYGAGI